VVGPLIPPTLNPTQPGPAPAKSPGPSPPPLAAPAARLFSPQSKSLGIDLSCLSPGLLKKVVYAGSNCPSFEQARDFLYHLAEVDLDVKMVRRATQRIGEERLAQRDLLVETWDELPLADKGRCPGAAKAPDLAVIMTDGGRVQILPDEDVTEGETPQNDPAPPTAPGDPGGEGQQAGGRRRGRFWRENKVAAVMTMSSETHQVDPCPELPEVFGDPLVVLKLAREVGHAEALPPAEPFRSSGSQQDQQQQAEQAEQQEHQQQKQKRPGSPEVLSRRVLATRQDNDAFGPMVAALAWSLGLMGALRGAFVADGAEGNWSIQKKYFPRFVAIVDFIHVLSYVFAAAMAGRTFAEGWPVYQGWIAWVWQGAVDRVLEAMRQRLGELAEDSKEAESVSKSLGYLEGQKGRMDYAEYRKQGLPVMSSVMESTVKQIGRRVKGTEKFWSEQGVEAVMQLRADYLSDDEPMEDFWRQRADRMTGQRTYKKRSA
jgi:hypothetical protein